MKKIYILIFFYSVLCSGIIAQPLPDSLKIRYDAAKTDSEKGKCLSIYMENFNGDPSGWKNILALISYFKENNDQVGEDYVQLFTTNNLAQTGEFNTALNQSLKILSRFESRHDNYGIMNAYHEIGLALYFSGDYGQCIIYCKKAMSLALLSGDKHILSTIYNDIGTTYNEMNKPDSGLIYAQKAVDSDYENNDSLNLSTSLSTLGESYIAKKEYEKAIPLIKKSIWIAKAFDNYHAISWSLNDLAQIFLETNQLDSARYYAQMAVELSNENSFKDQVLRAYEYLYKSYEKTDTKDSVYKYFRLSINTKDSLYTAQKAKDMQTFSFREQLRQQEIEQDKIQLQNKIRTYGLIIGIVVLLLIAFLLFKNNRSRKKANAALQKQNEVIHLENERKSKELEEARQLQLSMLPKEIPQLPNLDIAVYMKTATEVGGDYYDFNVGLDGTLTIAIGDATGHGMKAGTIVSMVKALFSSGGSRLDIKTFFDQSSDALKEIELGRLMMAFMMIKIKSNKIEIANAGMPPLFIYRKQPKAVEEIMINGMPLGAMKNFPYEIRETEIAAGDTLLLLSDGMPELKNDKDEQFGYTRLKDKYISVAEKEPEEIITYLKEEGSRWVNDRDPEDDVTFVVIKVK
ncbi:MAG: SpoIIE family protein phosphatase [Ignavibacteriaceae bacterium]|jgi:serine phosphatase RsbU (regulator of sigma subunit)